MPIVKTEWSTNKYEKNKTKPSVFPPLGEITTNILEHILPDLFPVAFPKKGIWDLKPITGGANLFRSLNFLDMSFTYPESRETSRFNLTILEEHGTINSK